MVKLVNWSKSHTITIKSSVDPPNTAVFGRYLGLENREGEAVNGGQYGGGVGTTVLRLLVSGLLASIIKSQFSKLNFNINGVARHMIIF